MGQHVYVEPDLGQENEEEAGSIWIGSFMVDHSDPSHPFVWKDVNGRLKQQEVTIGETRDEIGKVKITDGLSLEDSICMPDESLKEGMKTLPMSEKPAEEAVDDEDQQAGTEEGFEGEGFEGEGFEEEGFEGEGMEDAESAGEGFGAVEEGMENGAGVGLESGE